MERLILEVMLLCCQINHYDEYIQGVAATIHCTVGAL